ncbi:MAG: anhydro-N-acetylmuramic acid kinase [Bdellovibrionia bacterium]
MNSLKILGVMTGTSCDGQDAACVEVHSQGWSVLWSDTRGYPSLLRKRVLEFQKPGSTHTTLHALELNRDLGLWYASSLKKIISGHSKKPDVIANHGQTVAHFPKARAKGTTLQLGDGTRIAAATGLTVVHQFGEGDLAAGGQGAPLAPRFHQLLAQRLDPKRQGISFHNLGGISNLSYFGPKGKVLAFDTGPANLWIDAAMTQFTSGRLHYDPQGKNAARGQVDQQALDRVLKLPFFQAPPPKSTGRDDFPFELLLSFTRARGEDLVATATAITAQSIAQAYRNWILKARLPLKSIFLCGGGAKNQTLLSLLREQLPTLEVHPLNQPGLRIESVEATAFALLGYLSLRGEPLGGEWTGARLFAPPGSLIPGKNWLQVLEKILTHRLKTRS